MHRCSPVGTPSVRTPPPGCGISTRCTGCGWDRPGHQRGPDLWPLLPQGPRSPVDGPPVHPWAAALPLHTGQGREAIPPLHDPFPPARLPHRSVPSRGSTRGFTPPLRDGPLERRCRGVASVQPPVHPPADRLGLRHPDGVPRRPAADFCLAVRCDRSPLRPCRGFRMRCVFSVAAWFPGGATLFHPDRRPGRHADLPASDTALAMRRRRMYQVHPPAPGGLHGHGPARPGCTTPRIRLLCVAPPRWMGLPPDPTAR
jgi:hypothetical protein